MSAGGALLHLRDVRGWSQLSHFGFVCQGCDAGPDVGPEIVSGGRLR